MSGHHQLRSVRCIKKCVCVEWSALIVGFVFVCVIGACRIGKLYETEFSTFLQDGF